MSTRSHSRLTRALRAACLFAVCAALAVIGLPAQGHGHPPERITTATVPVYAGLTTDRRAELTAGIKRAQTAAWYEAAAKPPPVTLPHLDPPPSGPSHPPKTVPPSTSSADVDAAIARYFSDTLIAARHVAQCESTFDPNAIGGPNYGLFQINSVHADQWLEVTGQDFWSTWNDPDLNARFARWLYDQSGGWGPWACRPR